MHNFEIKENEKLFLDGLELKTATHYKLEHDALSQAELTITFMVDVNKDDHESEGDVMSMKTESNIITEIDETISVICKKVQTESLSYEYYGETVTALAALVEARAKLSNPDTPINPAPPYRGFSDFEKEMWKMGRLTV